MFNFYPAVNDKTASASDTEVFSKEIDQACHDISSACKGFGTDEEKLIDALGSLRASDRLRLVLRYQKLHQKELTKLLDSETSGNFGRLLELITVTLVTAECMMLREATKGFGTTEKHLIPILCGRTNDEMELLKKTYFTEYGKDLSSLMSSELGGDLKKFMLASMQAMTETYKPAVHTDEKAEADAEVLYKAGEGKWGTDEKTFFQTLLMAPPKHLLAMDAHYARKHGVTLETAAKSELGGKCEDAVVFAIQMVTKPYEAIATLFESTMKGVGTDEKGLTNCIVRYQDILPEIGAAYEKLYGQSLRDRINGETGGNYRDLLLKILRTNKTHSTSCN